ncbi:pantoate--beta-alanine ligase [Helicobacter sp. 13S00477-4]|uniref:pantoate--beta-alanine ligase n=1 Tax=Helicobacter sp. 13S00477-4 TaxID=1905759 RepID=UPI000BA7680F|nr:pantoate--beta-alanine ligase [Helicobacter sp. 13S00477-4]PAF52841.1 pantoate--beta-alanine ligase [Helicobacter sp. 13S00477-4]
MKTQLITTINDLIAYKNKLTKNSSIGFVPTMGYLHKGHLSLIEASKQNNACTFVSIFVNPTQFGPNEDFEQYPRDLQKDFKLCEENGVDIVFAPQASEIYHNTDEIAILPPKNMAYVYEGFIREGHFEGVLQIVLKLFNLIYPTNAYFGQKDAQQLLLIQRLVLDLFLPINIIPCPTQRDIDGLALSSRNIYLNKEERQNAIKIPLALKHISDSIKKGENKTSILIKSAKTILEGLDIEYFDICDYNLTPLSKVQKNKSLALLAAKAGKTRLIDNLWI